MTALITIRQAGSAITCDRGCYNAKHPNCDCQLCGGVNHGIGLERATANTRRLAPKWVEAAGEGAEVELDETVQQDPLFMIGDPMSALEILEGERALWQRRAANVLVEILTVAGTLKLSPIDWSVSDGLLLVGRIPATIDADRDVARGRFALWCAVLGATPGPEADLPWRRVLRAEAKPYRDGVTVLLICEISTDTP